MSKSWLALTVTVAGAHSTKAVRQHYVSKHSSAMLNAPQRANSERRTAPRRPPPQPHPTVARHAHQHNRPTPAAHNPRTTMRQSPEDSDRTAAVAVNVSVKRHGQESIASALL
eukprot:7380389-Prymnesium_polylepis.1